MADAHFQQRIARRFAALTVLLLIATLLATLAMQCWLCELFAHFTPFYLPIAALCVLGLALARHWRWCAAAAGLLAWHGYAVAQFLLQVPAAATSGNRPFTVFHFNAGAGQADPGRIVSHVRRNAKTIDVVVLIEATTDFDPALAALKDDYPHQIKQLDDSPFGIALASKHPIDYGAISFKPFGRYAHIEATLKLPGRALPLALYAIHPPPPLSAGLAAARNAKLDHIAALVAAQPQATPVVVGDFNVTPWSPYFKRFAAASGLIPTRHAWRLDHTWPVTFNNAHLGLAIDHSFAHPSLGMIERTIGPDLGSDHLPVTVTFGY